MNGIMRSYRAPPISHKREAMDRQLAWLKERVSLALDGLQWPSDGPNGAQTHPFDTLMQETAAAKGNGPKPRDAVVRFLSEESGAGEALMFVPVPDARPADAAAKDGAAERRSKSEEGGDSLEATTTPKDGGELDETKGADGDRAEVEEEGEEEESEGPIRLRLVEARRLQGGDVEESVGPIAYFVRTREGAVTSADGAASSESGALDVSDAVDWGVLTDEVVNDLRDVLREVFLPMLDPAVAQAAEAALSPQGKDDQSSAVGDSSTGGDREGSAIGASGVGGDAGAATGTMAGGATTEAGGGSGGHGPVEEDSVVQEFRSTFNKFVTHLDEVLDQLNSQIQLRGPDVDLRNPKAVAEDHEAVRHLEDTVEEWTGMVSGVMKSEEGKTKDLEGMMPLDTIAFWRARLGVLSAVYEQVQSQDVERVLSVLRDGPESALLGNFEFQVSELSKMFTEARDNVKFLTTLERHFKAIRPGNMTGVEENMLSMMKTLRFVWIISKSYSQDDLMVWLMRGIANAIADMVEAEVDVRKLFRMPPAKGLDLVDRARSVLESWYTTYERVREMMYDASNAERRWEFDRDELFKRTNYMARICQDLHEVITVVQEFRLFLGHELKEVVGDSQRIDNVSKQVDNLMSVQNVPFNLFDHHYAKAWEGVMESFHKSVQNIEDQCRRFIDHAFGGKKLRSAEGAFRLLRKFQRLKSREAINAQLERKFEDVLQQFSLELARVKDVFDSQRAAPPLAKGTPKVAGSIEWAGALFMRVKSIIVRFHKHGLLTSAAGLAVKDEYLALARDIDAYCQIHFERWCGGAVQLAQEQLKKSLLGPGLVEVKVGRNRTEQRLPPPPYHVNFGRELHVLIREAEALDKLGYAVPEIVLNVALQKQRYLQSVEALGGMLRAYDRAVGSLAPEHQQLLEAHHEQVREQLYVGFVRLNWTSLNIDHFIKACSEAITAFQSMVTQVQKNDASVNDVFEQIAKENLVSEEDVRSANGEPLELSDFWERLEQGRTHRLSRLARHFETIGPLVIKIEQLVANTNSGQAPQMRRYYKLLERRAFNAMVRMVVRSLSTLQGIMGGQPVAGFIEPLHVRPLCMARAQLSGNDVALQPTLQEVQRYVRRAVDHIVDSTKSFRRWLCGTCIPSEPVTLPGGSAEDGEETFVHSFALDVRRDPAVQLAASQLKTCVAQTVEAATTYLRDWRRFGAQYGLWNVKKRDSLEKADLSAMSIEFFDSRIGGYHRLAESLADRPGNKDVGFLRMDMGLAVTGIRRQAASWQHLLGSKLAAIAERRLCAVRERMDETRSALAEQPSDLASLKRVLNKISEVRARRLEMTLEIDAVEEMYRTLALYGESVPKEETESAASLAADWKAVVDLAVTVDRRLERLKDKFKAVTKQDVDKFKAETEELAEEYEDKGPAASGTPLDEGTKRLADFQERVGELSRRREELVQAETLFDLPLTPYPRLQSVVEDLARLDKVFALYAEYREFSESMSDMLWADMDIERLSSGVEALQKRLRRTDKELQMLPTFAAVQALVKGFQDSIPLIESLKDPSVKPRHWAEIFKLTGKEADMDRNKFRVSHVLDMRLDRFAEEVGAVTLRAKQEQRIEAALGDIGRMWEKTNFAVAKYKKGGQERGWVLRTAEEVQLELEEQLLNLQAMAASRFVGPFQELVSSWTRALNTTTECIEKWFIVQTKWIYLESIFKGSEDIRQQLPEEAKKFDKVDKQFRDIMAACAKEPNVLQQCTADNRLNTLNTLSDRLDATQKSLTDYLNTKRAAFPRFYFLSDDELLTILGASSPSAVEEHLLTLFVACKGLTWNRGQTQVLGMTSSDGEVYMMRTPAPVQGAVETWMTGVETEMHASLQDITKEGVFRYAEGEHKPGGRLQWIEDELGMVTLAGTQVWWTWQVEDAFRKVYEGDKYAMKNLLTKLTGQLTSLVAKVREKLNKLTRSKVNTLIITDVHARDIVDSFVRDSVLDAREFAWESQLRFYWDRRADDIVIRQCTGTFAYGYEYLGNSGRLVITPLTDRIVLTLTTALTFYLGGSPAGPAGTGKTETVKDLAKNLAIPCFVTNCGEGLDYRAVGSIFAGLAQIGAWGCFDEFNRINVEVLSVVSTQLRAIQQALASGSGTCSIGIGREISVHPNVGMFITMNPGYAGRTELPENLKAAFRPIAVIVPDLLPICEIMLYAEGFEKARVLAKKMTVLYSLAKGQLSKQYHYDFGLRALKSVLVMAGALKRQYTDMDEDSVLMRALRDMNTPKFVYEDVPLFQGLIADLFPGLEAERVGYADLKEAIAEDLDAHGFRHQDQDVFDRQVDKVVQLYETMQTRHTTQIVGPTDGGKSVVLHALRRSLKPAFGVDVKHALINPKAQPVSELYGVMDPVTRDWTDGILSKTFRALNRPLPEGRQHEMRWLIFDGDVDAVWVEDMNSVMDDNRLLTLPNSERIRLESHCKLLIETFDLQYASPATISRCGMVWVDPKDLGYRPYYERWVRQRCGLLGPGALAQAQLELEEGEGEGEGEDEGEDKGGLGGPVSAAELGPRARLKRAVEQAKQPGRGGENKAEEAEMMMQFFERYVPRGIAFVLEGVKDDEEVGKPTSVMLVGGLHLVRQLCDMMDAALSTDAPLADRDEVEGLFVFAFMWSIGALLDSAGRDQLAAMLEEWYLACPDKIFSCFYDPHRRKWMRWQEQVPAYEPPVPFEFSRIVVPTMDTVKYAHLVESQVAQRKSVLFVGETGTAKTTIIDSYCFSQDPELYRVLKVNFSSRTQAKDLYENIGENVEKRSGKTYGPAGNKKMLLFIDDLNMPRIDKYGTQQPLALLLYLLSFGRMYDRGKDLELRTYEDLFFLAAMGPPGGGRNPIDPRVGSKFSIFHLTPPGDEVLAHIYNSILSRRVEEFPPEIVQLSDRITQATLRLYDMLLERLPATPSKFHYIFNLRDLGRIYEGLCLATPDHFSDTASFVRLWRNETTRVFADRLVTDEDHELVTREIASLIGEVLMQGADAAPVLQDPLLYGDFDGALARIRDDGDTTEDARLYHDMGTFDDVRPIFSEVLEEYNLSHKAMNLVLFDVALEHLVRIHRVLRLPLGNALLVGVGGSGKQSLTRLASYTAGCRVFEIALSRGYGEAEFREDLKRLFEMLGEGETTFLFTDAHVVEEGFLELVNNLLTSGMVPALFESEEKDKFANSVREEVRKQGLVDTNEACWNYFVTKCRRNLHVVLAMSPAGDTLRLRCRNFPGMISSTVVDWFFPWPKEALATVAESFLAEETLPEDVRDSITEHIVSVHLSVIDASVQFKERLRRVNHVTPKNYLDFLDTYRTLLQRQRGHVAAQAKRLEGGLQKLLEAAASVDRMEVKLKEQKKVVDKKTKDCEEMIEDITSKSEEANKRQGEAQKMMAELEANAVVIAEEKEKANVSLKEAEPALRMAREAVDELDKKDIQEIKVMTNPNKLVKDVCVCVLYFRPLGTEEDTAKDLWKAAKAMMSNTKFIESLKNYDVNKIKDKMVRKVRTYLKNPKFTAEAMQGISKAAAGMLKWVQALVTYYDVAKNVEPLRQRVFEMEKEAGRSEKALKQTNKELAEIKSTIETLEANYESASTELADLKKKAQIMEKRLLAASKLITGLGGERERWTTDKEGLLAKKERLVGDCLQGAAFLSYLGAFTADFRSQLLKDTWEPGLVEQKVPMTTPFDLPKLMVEEATKQAWASQGLPSDPLSIENGILTTMGTRFPLCIDPQQQAVHWIKKREEKNALKVKTFNDGDFLKNLELALQFGNPFLFEAVGEELDPVIDPVLERNTFKQGSQVFVNLGDKAVEWSPDFRLYMTSKLANPSYSPEVAGKVMLINYSVTVDGLENQLLDIVVAHDRPDLERQYRDLVIEMSENTQMLLDLEDTLLRELAESQGDLLDNDDLIGTLETCKTKAVEISGKLEQAQFTNAELAKARSGYKPAAKRGSILFFAMTSLSVISKMYEISLASFLKVFDNALDRAKRDANLSARLKNIIETSTQLVYDYMCTGIFARHKLMFSFHMTCLIMEGEGELNRTELDFFLKGDVALEGPSRAKPVAWISDQGWKDLLKLADIGEAFQGIAESVEKSEADWREWYDLESPESSPLPHGFGDGLDPFQQLLVQRCLRPDRVYNGVTLFVIHKMGEYYVQPPVLNYMRIFKQSASTTPIVFVLSPGADPESEIKKLAEECDMGKSRLKTLALGQGQGPVAEDMIKSGAQRGFWVLLQNCHLLTSWLGRLEALLETITEPHEDFRLWLTTDPTDKFPLGILQRSLKVVTEPPDGLKMNMRASYSQLTDATLENCPHSAFRPLLYVLCFYHAVLQERRKFGKIGWNVSYAFNESDLLISRQLLSLYLTKAYEDGDDTIPWGSLKYLIGDAMYGGRVTDDFDRRVLTTYLEEYMGPHVFDDFQTFYFSRAGHDYTIPDWGPLENYREGVDKLPLLVGPPVFGLHSNAEIGYYTNATKALWRNLVLLQPRVGGSGEGMSREEYIGRVAKEVREKLPPLLEAKAGQVEDPPSPTDVVLLQELERFRALTQAMRRTLKDLERALIGEIGMSEELDALGDSLFNGQLPAQWRKLCPHTEKPLGSWMAHFLRRFEQYREWLDDGEPNVMWLSGLHIPESYLTALVQAACRRRNWPLDRSTLYTKVTKYMEASEVETRPEYGCFVVGLHLEGAGWDLEHSCLKSQEPKVLVTELPILQVIPIEASKLKLHNTFKTPVYVTQARRDAMGVGLVFEADLTTQEHPSHWTLQGVALVLNTDE